MGNWDPNGTQTDEQEVQTGEQSAGRITETAQDLAKRGIKNGVQKSLKKDGSSAAKQGGRAAARAAAEKAKVAAQATRAAARAAAQAAAQIGKTLITGAVKVVVGLVGGKLALIVIVVLVILAIIVSIFLSIEQQQATAFQDIGYLMDTYCQSSAAYVENGYTSMGGLTEEEFQGLIKEPDGVLFTGQLSLAGNEALNNQLKSDLNELSPPEERSRIKMYLMAERDSTLMAAKENTYYHKLSNAFAPEDERIRSPRLEFKNDTYDFEGLEYKFGLDPWDESKSEAQREKELKIMKEIAAMREAIVDINKYIKGEKEIPDGSKYPDSMKNINGYLEKKIVVTDGSLPKVLPYPTEDQLYKLLEPYALSWKMLYLIDKSLGENERGDFSVYDKIANGSLSEAEIKQLISGDKMKFILQAIPRFMPEYDVKRHLIWQEKYTRDESCYEDEEGCHTPTESHSEITVRPVYTLERVENWEEERKTPTYVKVVTEIRYDYSKCGCNGQILEDMVKTVTKTPEYAPPEGVKEDPGPEIEYAYKYGQNRVVRYYDEDYIVEGDPKQEIISKGEYLQKILTDIYGAGGTEKITYDLRHGVQMAKMSPSFYSAGLMVSRGFNLPDVFLDLPFGPGLTADISYIRDKYPNRPVTRFLVENIDYINYVATTNGIPAPAMIGQLIGEIGWDMKMVQGSNNLFNIKGKGPAGSVSAGGSNWRAYHNYKESIDDYVRVIKQTWPEAVEAARTGGSGAFLVALQATPDKMYCEPSTPPYEEFIMKVIVDSHLVGTFLFADPIFQGGFTFPVPSTPTPIITSPFGPRTRPCDGCSKYHQGIDVGVPAGTPILAIADGVVEQASFSSCGGYYIRIRHNNDMASRYLHLKQGGFKVKPGDEVEAGQVIALSGNTGTCTTGAHLHHEIIVQGRNDNPLNYLPKVYSLSR